MRGEARDSGGLLARVPSTSLARREVLSPKRDRIGPGTPKGIVKITGDDGDAETLSIVLAPQVDPDEPLAHGPCVAIVEWGTGSGTAVAEVDFAKGTIIQVAASSLEVAGRNDGNESDGSRGIDGELRSIDSDPGDQEVAVIVSGYGQRPATGRPTRTFYFGSIPAGGSRTVIVPNFARSFLVTRSPTVTTSIAIEVSDGFQTQSVRDGRHVFSGIPADRIDLFSLASVVVISNAGSTSVDRLQIAFELSL